MVHALLNTAADFAVLGGSEQLTSLLIRQQKFTVLKFYHNCNICGPMIFFLFDIMV